MTNEQRRYAEAQASRCRANASDSTIADFWHERAAQWEAMANDALPRN